MRHRRHRPRLTSALLVGLAGLTAGACAHNDVLVFGTSTTIGLDVQTASTHGAAPSIVLGYRREEAVWMPLLANGRDSELALCSEHDDDDCDADVRAGPLRNAMYQSRYTPRGGTERVDAYSVFASLGARFNGDAGRDGVGAGGGLAQFFATGAAAVSVTENPALVTALKIESAAGAEAQADAVAFAAPLSETQRAAADQIVGRARDDLTFVLACTTAQGKDWATLVGASTLSPGRKQLFTTVPADQRRAALEGDEGTLAALAAAASAAGCTR